MGMKEMRQTWRRWVREAAEELDLPQSALTGQPSLVLDGGEVEIHGHYGILQYTKEEISVAVKDGSIRVTGSEMTLTAMNTQSLRFSGMIVSIELLSEGGAHVL